MRKEIIGLMDTPIPIAICCSDLHLSLAPPACRRDADWMEAQRFYLRQLKRACFRNGKTLPVLCAGDIFDRWNAPAELINFALAELPDGMLCVPGQHDLPNHRLDLVHRSAYGVLKSAGKIVDLSDEEWVIPNGLRLVVYGFGWKQPVTKPKNPSKGIPHVAVIHRYVWTAGNSYTGAQKQDHLISILPELSGYHAAIFGDNHKGFLKLTKRGTFVLNCGGFIRRKIDEVSYTPTIGVLFSDGSIKRRKLDTSIDSFHYTDKQETPEFNMDTLLTCLEELRDHGLDFREIVEERLRQKDIPQDVKEIVLASLEK